MARNILQSLLRAKDFSELENPCLLSERVKFLRGIKDCTLIYIEFRGARLLRSPSFKLSSRVGFLESRVDLD